MSVRPIVFLDVDGVLTPLVSADELPSGYEQLTLPNGTSCVLNQAHGRALLALMEQAELVWATTWGDGANDIAGPLLGLPRLPVATHSRPKLPGLLAYAGGRPFVWLDDDVSPMDVLRIELRAERIPTSLVLVNPSLGLTVADLSRAGEFIAAVAGFGEGGTGAD